VTGRRGGRELGGITLINKRKFSGKKREKPLSRINILVSQGNEIGKTNTGRPRVGGATMSAVTKKECVGMGRERLPKKLEGGKDGSSSATKKSEGGCR